MALTTPKPGTRPTTDSTKEAVKALVMADGRAG